MNRAYKLGRKQSGMTLIEIMVALLLGAFLLGGVIQILINAKQSYRLQDNLSRIQENGRLGLDFIARDIRMTGYWGCLTKVAGDITPIGNNSITLRGVFSPQTIPAGTATTLLSLVSPPTISCGSSVDVTQAYYTHQTSIITYAVTNNTLTRSTNNQGAQQLIEGVDDLQFQYGVDVNGDKYADYYVPSANVTVANRENIVSIRVNLLIRSLDDNLTDSKMAYFFMGQTQPAAADYRLRRAFTTTVAVRNRLQ